MYEKLCIMFVVALIPFALAGQWTEMNVNLEAGWGSEIEAIDYDLDGDLDIFLCGSNTPSGSGFSRLYRNDGNWNYTQVTTSIIGVYKGYSAWDDFNRDGYMDVVITGRINETNAPVARLYLGNANHTFCYAPMPWIGLYYSWIDTGDYNNDGNVDILMTGVNSGNDYVKLYRNDGNLEFTEVATGIQNMSAGQCHFVDYDNDGDLDISVLGSGANIIYRNDGSDAFSNIHALLENLRFCSSDWGDFDNDGYLDLIISGETDNGTRTYIYTNHGDGTFTLIPNSIPGVLSGSVKWGDYDNDGWLDIVIAGNYGQPYGPRIAQEFINNCDRTFSEQGPIFTPVSSCKIVCGDLNNDLKLDMILSGYTGGCYVTNVYKNIGSVANIPPAPPDVVFNDNTGTFSFSGASDTTTPDLGLSYNLRIGTSPGGNEVLSVLEDGAGFRRTVSPGRKKYQFELHTDQTYYASAQTIDHAFTGSAFGPELTILPHGIPSIAFAESDSIDFGAVYIGEHSLCDTLWIVNTGTAILQVDSPDVIDPGQGFQVLTTGFPYQVQPSDSLAIVMHFTPHAVGFYNTFVNIHSNAMNSPMIQASVFGTGIYAPPSAVQNVRITMRGYDAVISWDPVYTSVLGTPLVPDSYLLLYSDETTPESFELLTNTSALSYTHRKIGDISSSMFYKVKAYIFYDEVNEMRLQDLNNRK